MTICFQTRNAQVQPNKMECEIGTEQCPGQTGYHQLFGEDLVLFLLILRRGLVENISRNTLISGLLIGLLDDH